MASFSPPAYLILGHGTDMLTPFDERRTVPEGVIVLMWVAAGVAADPKDACPVLRVFRDPTKTHMVAKPLDFLDEWASLSSTPLRVYTTGMRLPNVKASMATTWKRPLKPAIEINGTTVRSGVVAMRSGMYRYPITAPPMPQDFPIEHIPGGAEAFAACQEDVGYVPYDVQRDGQRLTGGERLQALGASMYVTSILPLGDLVAPRLEDAKTKPWITSDPFAPLQAVTTYSLYDLIDSFGPGLYVFPVCRSLAADTTAFRRYAGQVNAVEADEDPYRIALKPTIHSSLNALQSVRRFRKAYAAGSTENRRSFDEWVREGADEPATLEAVEREMDTVRLQRVLSNLQQKQRASGGRRTRRRRKTRRR